MAASAIPGNLMRQSLSLRHPPSPPPSSAIFRCFSPPLSLSLPPLPSLSMHPTYYHTSTRTHAHARARTHTRTPVTGHGLTWREERTPGSPNAAMMTPSYFSSSCLDTARVFESVRVRVRVRVRGRAGRHLLASLTLRAHDACTHACMHHVRMRVLVQVCVCACVLVRACDTSMITPILGAKDIFHHLRDLLRNQQASREEPTRTRQSIVRDQ